MAPLVVDSRVIRRFTPRDPGTLCLQAKPA